MACGGVSATGDGDGDGDGDAGGDCGGTVDMDGNCVCEPRLVPPACDTCAEGWDGASCGSFTDNFDRAAGALGPEYEPNAGQGLADDVVIVNNRGCGDNQSLGLLTQIIDSPDVSAELDFDPGNVEGQEVSFLITDNPVLGIGGVFIAGCDGGGGVCNLRITEIDQQPLVEMPLPDALPAGVLHHLSVSTDGSQNIQLSLTPAGGAAPTTISAKLPPGFATARLGFIVGRQADGNLSCVDNFSVQIP